MRVERGHLVKAKAVIERGVPIKIAEGCQGHRLEAGIARINQAGSYKPGANAASLKPWVDVHFPNVKLSSEGLAGEQAGWRFTDMTDQAVALADQPPKILR